MRVKILTSSNERQGGVSTYVSALEKRLPIEGVKIANGDGDYDVLLHVGPHIYDGLPPKDGRRSVMVVHDLIPEILWKDACVREERKRALAAADEVIAVSGWTKADLLREYGVDPKKIHVIYHGVPAIQREVEENAVACPYNSGSYLLYVGKRNEYKRFRWFLRAVAPLMWLHPGLRILCTGEPFCRREWAWIVALGLLGRVKTKRFAADEMYSVYANAAALIYPSVYEGFGLPVLEAMSAGCPVVCSRSTCLPEVAGDAAVYFQADDADDLRRVVGGLISRNEECEKRRAELVRKGGERAKLFSWEKCTHETAAVLVKVKGKVKRGED